MTEVAADPPSSDTELPMSQPSHELDAELPISQPSSLAIGLGVDLVCVIGLVLGFGDRLHLKSTSLLRITARTRLNPRTALDQRLGSVFKQDSIQIRAGTGPKF